MGIKLYNFLSRQKETFKPLRNKKAGIYTCGPTVYDRAHIGNLRTYIFEDTLKRVLNRNGYKVKHVMNITDVEDKIIKKMRDERKTLKEITEPVIDNFFEDLKKLNIKKADVYPRATETIREIVKLVAILLKKKYAYKGADNSIYFNISKFKNYGRLSKLEKGKIKSELRISSDEYGKKEASDFSLWKSAKPDEPSWDAVFGKGRPGWHIECSAMSMKYLGESFDIHCGAIDLLFPHHENEIAQSEAATGKKFVNFWLEGEHLLVDDKKMSKSSGNFYTLEDIEKRGFDPLSFRYLVLTSHYRMQLNFTWKSLEAAQNAFENLKHLLRTVLKNPKGRSLPTGDSGLFRELEEKFLRAVSDDLNMPKALAILWETVRPNGLSPSQKRELILKFDRVLGLELEKIKPLRIPARITALIEKRERLREEKKWQEADLIRQELAKKGWMVKDTSTGPEISKTGT